MVVKRATKRSPRGVQSTPQSTSQPEKVPAVEEEGEMIGNLFDNMKDDTVVIVHRFDPQAGRLVLMYKLMPEEATDIEIQRLSGGGKYTTREHVRNEEGKMVFGRHRTVIISGLPRMAKMPRSYEHPEPTASVKTEVNTVESKTGLDDVLTAGVIRLLTSSAEVGETQAKMYQTMMGRSETDWAALVVAVMPLLLKLVERKDDGPNPMEIATQIAEMMKQNTSPTTQFKDMLETVDSVFSIKEQAAGPPADPLTALAATLPQILEIITSEQKTKGRMPTQEEVKRRLVTPSTQPPGGKMPVYRGLLNKFAPMLVQWAREGKDPGLMGEFLFNSIPSRFHGAVREFLLREDAENLVYQTVPDLREFPQWTQDCFGRLAEEFGIVEEEATGPEADATFDVGEDGVGTEVVEETIKETSETVEE